METIANLTTMDVALEARRAKRRQYREAYKTAHPDKFREGKRRAGANARARMAAQRSGVIPPVMVVDPAMEERRLEDALVKQELSKAAQKARTKEYNCAYYAKLKAARIAMAAA